MDRGARGTLPVVDWLLYAPGIDLFRALGRFELRAHLVASSRSFRAALPAERPRVVVLAMPPGRSADLALLAHERRRRPSMTAVVLTEDRDDDRRYATLAGGVDATLPLGMGGDELVARLERLGRGRELADDRASLPLGDGFVIDTARPELRRGAEIVHLRPREHALLLVFARHPGQLFTRRELLDRAWSAAHEIGPRTVDVHIRWLRQKLESDPAAPRRLLTVRGTGYRLAPPRRRRQTTPPAH